jgi:hypothetical protein
MPTHRHVPREEGAGSFSPLTAKDTVPFYLGLPTYHNSFSFLNHSNRTRFNHQV